VEKLRSAIAAGAVLLCLAAIAPSTALAGSISGTVTAEGGGPIQGVEVCAQPTPYYFETACVETDAEGHYSSGGLAASDYRISFSVTRHNLRWITEYYEDKLHFSEADFFHLEDGQAATVDAELAEGGSISGTVVDETDGHPIDGLWACAIDEEGETPRCAPSDAAGEYLINGLPSGSYNIEYRGENLVNYLREFYEDADTWGAATEVGVIAPATTSDIDAELAPGAEILGRVTEIGTGAPFANELVCAEQPGYEGYEQAGCDWTDDGGEYAIRGLPAGTYVVSFGLEYTPLTDYLARGEWWQDAASIEEADPITIAPPESRSGIDAQLPHPYWLPEPETEPESEPRSNLRALVVPAPLLKRPLRKCRKGFHRRRVEGKKRCVRKHRPHRKHRR
jgi:hypothetical protein